MVKCDNLMTSIVLSYRLFHKNLAFGRMLYVSVFTFEEVVRLAVIVLSGVIVDFLFWR